MNRVDGTQVFCHIIYKNFVQKFYMFRGNEARGMYLVGSDDGVYRVSTPVRSDAAEATKTLDSGRVMRLRQFEGVRGIFAATKTGLYRSLDGERWTDLNVPREEVYAVGMDSSGEDLYVGTRPAHVYVTESLSDDDTAVADVEWAESTGFQELPSREAWRLPRHDDLAQVRDLRRDPATSNRVVAGVEVGGVHVSDDGGDAWTERSDGVDDDVHELHVVGPEEYVAATGHGLFDTSDAGRTWRRRDVGVPQSYFRCAFSIGGVVYVSGALSNSSTWDDDDAEPALFRCRDDSLEPIPIPYADETVTGMTAVDGDLVVATHRGHLLSRSADGWDDLGLFPVSGPLTGRYTPIASYDDRAPTTRSRDPLSRGQ